MILANKITVAFMVWAMICAGIAVFAIGPAVANLFSIESNVKEEDALIADRANRIKQIEAFRDFSRSNGGNLVKIDELFINAQSPLDMFDFLEKSAEDTGVKLTISSSTDVSTSAKEAWSSLSFQMTLAGKFPSILKFIKIVESGQYLVSLPGVSISGQQDADSNQTAGQSESLKATATLTAYVTKKPKQ